MKKMIAIVTLIITIILCSGCQTMTMTKDFGGSMTVKLKPNEKLELITWKDESLWYCTRPMREGEAPEVHTYQQSSEFGVFEGTVTIIETK